MTEHIVAVFANDSQAASAERELVQAGVPSSAIRRYARGSQTGGATAQTTGVQESGTGGGFWSWLLGEEPQTTASAYPHAADTYDRNLDAGRFVLSVTLTDDSQIHQAVTILDRYDPIDMDERTEETDGVTGQGTTAAAYGSAGTAYTASGTVGAATPAQTTPILQDRATTTATANTGKVAAGEEVLPLAEEQLEIAKRVVDRGTRRVRRYVVETPVEREVTLHGERVTIERRRPTGVNEAGVAGAFEERVVEVHETEEVPEVRKTARVVEEVAIRREATERKETIRDTVRRDEVEMAPDPTDKRQQG